MVNKCLVCGRTDGLESHHITPIHLGGEDDSEQVWLCSNCHQNIHKMAEELTSKAVTSGKKQPNNYFSNQNQFDIAKYLIKAIMDAKIRFETLPQSDNPRRRMLVLEIGDRTWQKLHKVKADKGYKSMKKFITDVLVKLSNS